jgi:hypothetical protein
MSPIDDGHEPRHALNSKKCRLNLDTGFAASATESFTNKRRGKIDSHIYIYRSSFGGEGEHNTQSALRGEESKNLCPLLPLGVHE